VRESEQASSLSDLGCRLRLIREEVFGPEGLSELAARLGIPAPAWQSYEEMGELAPAQILLRFIEVTGADPLWLLRAEGPRYREGKSARPRPLDPNTADRGKSSQFPNTR
jgi:hypothetical protein